MTDRLYFTDIDEANVLLVEDRSRCSWVSRSTSRSRCRRRSGAARAAQRLGTLEPARVAAAPLEEIFRQRPAIHRFPGSMARRVNDLAAHIDERYDGDAARVWTDASTRRSWRKLMALPGSAR